MPWTTTAVVFGSWVLLLLLTLLHYGIWGRHRETGGEDDER